MYVASIHSRILHLAFSICVSTDTHTHTKRTHAVFHELCMCFVCVCVCVCGEPEAVGRVSVPHIILSTVRRSMFSTQIVACGEGQHRFATLGRRYPSGDPFVNGEFCGGESWGSVPNVAVGNGNLEPLLPHHCLQRSPSPPWDIPRRRRPQVLLI